MHNAGFKKRSIATRPVNGAQRPGSGPKPLYFYQGEPFQIAHLFWQETAPTGIFGSK
jgi:hypothetical protein